MADDPVHLLIIGDRARASAVAGNVSQGLAAIAAARFERARIRPVESKRHLESLVPYLLHQSTHHQLTTAAHPATWEGSSFQDLVQARILPGFQPLRLKEILPRLGREDVWGAVGLEPLEPVPDEVLAELGVETLTRACREAVGLGSLDLRTPDSLRARAVAAKIAGSGSRTHGSRPPSVCRSAPWNATAPDRPIRCSNARSGCASPSEWPVLRSDSRWPGRTRRIWPTCRRVPRIRRSNPPHLPDPWMGPEDPAVEPAPVARPRSTSPAYRIRPGAPGSGSNSARTFPRRLDRPPEHSGGGTRPAVNSV